MMRVAADATQIADVVYEALTDGKDQVNYVAGEDAQEKTQKQFMQGV
ncbi:hypothetical protein [Spirosoma sp. KNUC1025]